MKLKTRETVVQTVRVDALCHICGSALQWTGEMHIIAGEQAFVHQCIDISYGRPTMARQYPYLDYREIQ